MSITSEMNEEKWEIINRFIKNVKGRVADTSMSDSRHDGSAGHWLETQMGIAHNADNQPDLFGYEMKNATKSKTTFGDWSADYYIFKDNYNYSIDRDRFLEIFGKPNEQKGMRFSWSGEPCPAINKINRFGQTLIVKDNDIYAIYNYSQDTRNNKQEIVPDNLKLDDIILAKWNHDSIKQKLERKFNNKGWFKCVIDKNGVYTSIVFGEPMTFDWWIKLVQTGVVFFDSGMYQGNKRNYSQWRANNSLWESLITSRYE